MFRRNSAAKLAKPGLLHSVLAAGRNQAARQDWIHHALGFLSGTDGIHRIGLWLEPEPGTEQQSSAAVFHGQVWESDGAEAPAEWGQLSADAPLPEDLLNRNQTIEYQLDGFSAGPLLASLVGLERVLWVPVVARQMLRGLLLLGTREKHRQLPKRRAEEVAAELAWLLDGEHERRLSKQRQNDLALTRQLHSSLSSDEPIETILNYLADSCTLPDDQTGVGAIFALIGQRKSGLPVARPADSAQEERLLIRAQSGDSAWAHSAETGRLETLWRQAIESGRLEGADADRLPLAKNISRIVAIPLLAGGRTEGVLVAGIPRGADALETLGRLELRAQLATQVFRHESVARGLLRNRAWQEALLDSSPQSLLLVDHGGFILGMSRGARELLKEIDLAEPSVQGDFRLAELFRPREWEEVTRWIAGEFHEGENPGSAGLLAELQGGEQVRLGGLILAGDKFLAVGLQPAEQPASQPGVPELHAELQQTLEWLEEGVLLFDAAGKIRAMNSRVQQMLGLTAGEAREMRTAEDLIERVSKNAADPAAFATAWRALGATNTFPNQEELAMEFPVQQTIERCARQITGTHGMPLGRVEVYQEMSARRMFQSRMVQTEKLASLGQRAIGIVHELTNPLTAILGNAQRLVLRHSEAGRSPEAHRIFEEAVRATSILRQLLYLSRETQPAHQRISLNDLVERTAELQKASLAGTRITLRLEHQTPLPPVEGDFAQLQQVLLNLLANSQQAIEHSGVGSTIGVRTYLKGETYVQLEVWDDGPGIPPAVQAHIYDPFFTTKAPGEGTGLGLSIALGFVRQHGGSMSLISPPEGGSRFLIELPVSTRIPLVANIAKIPKRLPGSVAHPEKLALAAGGNPPQRAAFRVLVVEDEPTVAALIADLLRDQGLNVDVLLDSRPALRQIERGSYDLLICDVKMPEIDGPMLYNSLIERRLPLQHSVLFVTGDVLAARSQEFLARHQLPHVAKPFRMEELSAAVNKMLQKLKSVNAADSEMTTGQWTGNG